MKEIPTTTNGRIPPRVRKVTFTEVAHPIGKGVEGDPIRVALSYYDDDGNHLWTFDYDKLICRNNIDAFVPAQEVGDGRT